MDKYVLITGASSGLGKEIASTLAQKGFKVLAGVRKEEDRLSVEALNPNIKGVFIDVTDQTSVDSAFNTVKAITNELYAIVNNAGIAMAGPVECLPVDVIKKQFEVNVYGAIRVTQKFMQLFNDEKDSRIINISSMASFGLFPFVSPYCASKRALDIFFNALLLECKKPNLKVISIKPGVVKTNIWDKSINACNKVLEDIPDEFKDKYKNEYVFLTANAKKNNHKGLNAQDVAKLVEKVLTIKHPKLSYCIGFDSKMTELYSMLPLPLINFLTKKMMNARFRQSAQ